VSYEHGQTGDLYVANADGTSRTRVTCAPGWVDPAWSPDGKHLVTVSSRGSGLHRLTVPAPGGPCVDSPVRITTGSVNDGHPTWARVVLPR
jgi:Tol biopolymer transport system component